MIRPPPRSTLFPYRTLFRSQPIPTLARVAADAEGMTLGTGCLLLPLHHPVEVAEQLATLDVIAGGRFVFGVGLGYRDVENEAVGQDPKERVGRLVERSEEHTSELQSQSNLVCRL